MTHRHVVWALLGLSVGSCARAPIPVPVAVQRIAVFPPNNQTGDPLLVAAGTALEGYTFATERVTVPDLLAAEARTQLTRRGFALVDPRAVDSATRNAVPSSVQDAAAIATRNKIDGAVLYTVVRQWEPDNAFQPRTVVAAVEVSLVDAASGRVLWSAEHPARPIQTDGAISVGQAYGMAARMVMEQLLLPLTPAHAGR